MKCEGETGREAGMGEARELPGCGQGALAFTFTLSAFLQGRNRASFEVGCRSGVPIDLRAQKGILF